MNAAYRNVSCQGIKKSLTRGSQIS